MKRKKYKLEQLHFYSAYFNNMYSARNDKVEAESMQGWMERFSYIWGRPAGLYLKSCITPVITLLLVLPGTPFLACGKCLAGGECSVRAYCAGWSSPSHVVIEQISRRNFSRAALHSSAPRPGKWHRLHILVSILFSISPSLIVS